MKKDVEVVPDKLDSPINYKIIGMIVLCVVAVHVIVNFVLKDESDNIVLGISIINPLAAGITGVFVGLRYAGTKIFQRSYTSLGLGYLFVGAGEITYAVYEKMFEEVPYPSLADVFFLAFYPLAIAHLIINLKFFAPKIRLPSMIWLVLLPISITVVFLNVYNYTEVNGEFLVSMGYIVPAAITITLTIYGTTIFKEGIVGKVWMILLFGILSITFADMWFSYLEANDGYDLQHPVNLFWYAGYWIVVYSLLKHRKAI